MSVDINEEIGRVSAEEFFVSVGNIVRGTFRAAESGVLTVGAAFTAGFLRLSGEDGSISGQRFLLKQALLRLGANGDDGDILLYRSTNTSIEDPSEQPTITLDGNGGNIFAGGQGTDGDLILRSENNQDRIRLDANGANGWFGGNGEEGDIVLFASSGDNATTSEATIHLNGGTGDIIAGGNGSEGDLVLKHSTGQNRIRLDANGANGWFGGNGEEGDIVLFASSGDNATTSEATIHLNGGTGDIILQNADCAEDFEVDTLETVEPGTVMAICDGVRLRISDQAYDHRVAGIVAGAGDYRPGIILGRKPGGARQLPIALMGRVFCKVDTTQGAIKVGDLLTTSSVPGHAMKVCDPGRAFGAVIGKALEPLAEAQGLIPVLVTLQ